jgi:hypothetical protein
VIDAGRDLQFQAARRHEEVGPDLVDARVPPVQELFYVLVVGPPGGCLVPLLRRAPEVRRELLELVSEASLGGAQE